MRISFNWLKDFLSFGPDMIPETVADALTMAGLEVESVERVRDKSQAVLLAEVTKVQDGTLEVMIDGQSHQLAASPGVAPHHVLGVLRDAGEHGAPTFRVATFADIGFDAGGREAIVLDSEQFDKLEPKTLAEVPLFDDTVITIGVTPNRADALSHLGVSRELSALFELTKKMPMISVREMSGPTHERVLVEVENPKDCPRYALRIIEGITVKESPLWLKVRLLACGIRPINNVVDTTNYVMMALGQPMHAFDFDHLKREGNRVKVTVRRAVDGETLVSLDDAKLELTSDDLVIADVGGPVALAGVIGGKASGVMSNTATVLLEAAYFEPTLVRHSAKSHHISTDSSYRFERGTDPNLVVESLNFAAQLLVDIAGGRATREPLDVYRHRLEPLEVKLRPERARRLLGMSAKDFDEDLVRRKFRDLGIETVVKQGDAIYFRVPRFRADITREIDLIEEAARMIGYEKVGESSLATADLGTDFVDENFENLKVTLQRHLVARGFFEAINYAFLSKEYQENFFENTAAIAVKNPLSERYGVMRLSLIPGLVKNVNFNLRNQESSVFLYETGTVFLGVREGAVGPRPEILTSTLDQDSYAIEKSMIAGVISGLVPRESFDATRQESDFYTLKGIVSDSLRALGLNVALPFPSVRFEAVDVPPFLHPGESATIRVLHDDTWHQVGVFGRLHPEVQEKLAIERNVYVFEIDLSGLFLSTKRDISYRSFSRFPTISRDIALLVDDDVFVGDLLQLGEEVDGAKEVLRSVKVFDVYRGKNIEAGKKSVAIAMGFQHQSRTLTDDEANTFINIFVEKANAKFQAVLR